MSDDDDDDGGGGGGAGAFPPEAVIFVTTFDDVVSGNVSVTESLVGSTLSALSCLESIDPVIDILIEWAVSEFPASRDWEALRFTALIIAGIFRMSPLSLRRELLLLLRLESLPWHLRLLVGTHLMEEDPFSNTVCTTNNIIDDPLLPLIAKKRTTPTATKSSSNQLVPASTKNKYEGNMDSLTVELYSRLLMDESGVAEYKKELTEVKKKLSEFTKRYPWAAAQLVVKEEAAAADLTLRQ